MSLEAVDRGIYEKLRKKVVSMGYLPDITLYTTEESYANAKESLKATLQTKTLIDVFGIGSSQSRQEKTDAKIVIDRLGIRESNTATYGGIKYYKNADDTFTKVKLPNTPYNIDYEIRIVSTTAKMDRIMHSIVLSTLGSNVYVPMIINGLESSTESFLSLFNGSVDITKEVFIERVFRITAQEVWLVDEEVIKDNVPMLVEVAVDMFTAKKEDNLEDTETVARLTEDKNKVSFKVRG